MGTNAIVGGGVPQSGRVRLVRPPAGGTDVGSVTYFGDGAVKIGRSWRLSTSPRPGRSRSASSSSNNQYPVSTHVAEVTAEPRPSARGLGVNIPSWRVDGMDPLAVRLAMTEAVEHTRAGNGPTIVEAGFYRFFHQNGPFPGSALGYRTKDEEKGWSDRDPSP